MHVEVKLSEIKPNPFRMLDKYSLDRAKIEKLKASITRTDFWHNVVARQRDGSYELAYGHHRIQAAREVLGQDAVVHVIVRELDDATMLKVMASDNDPAYDLSPAFILETVEAAKDFVERNPDRFPVNVHRKRRDESPLARIIAELLGWPYTRVKEALAQLRAVEREEVSNDALRLLPTAHAAAVFQRQMEKAKGAGKPVAREKQLEIARNAAKAAAASPTKIIENEVADIVHPLADDERNRKDFVEFLGETAKLGEKFSTRLDEVIRLREDFEGDVYRNTVAAICLRDVCLGLAEKISKLSGDGNHDGLRGNKPQSRRSGTRALPANCQRASQRYKGGA